MLWTVVSLAVIGGLLALYWTWKRKRQGKPVIPDAKEPKADVA